MGDSDDPNLSYSAQQVNELLRCPICWDRFRSPKLLPCQHTFCERPCLEQLVDRFHRIKCPECRVEHRVPYQGVSALPTNRTLLNFLDLSAQTLPSIPLHPPDNQQNQPESVEINHQANDRQGNPNIDNTHTAPSNTTGSESQRSGCFVCGRHIPLLRCSHCDNVICDTCKRSHMDQLRLDVNRLVSQLRRGMPSFSQAIGVIEAKSESLHQRAEAGKSEITETIERYISELRNRQRLLHSEVQMWLLGEIRSLRMCQENVEVELASTASFCDSTESVLSRPNQVIPDQDLVDIKRQCVEHIETMRAYEDGTGVRLPRERQVQVQFEGNRFSTAISNFGEFIVVEGADNGTTGPPSNSRSSSSRESSPRLQPVARSSTGATPRTANRAPPFLNHSEAPQSSQNNTLDRALDAIGSSITSVSSPRPAPRRRGERMAGLMGAGGGGGERMAGLMGGAGLGSGDSSDSSNRGAARQPVASRSPRLPHGGVTSETVDSESGPSSTEGDAGAQPGLPQNLSWELPLDLAYPHRRNIRAGNGGAVTNRGNRRSLQERRRHNLSDSSVHDRDRSRNQPDRDTNRSTNRQQHGNQSNRSTNRQQNGNQSNRSTNRQQNAGNQSRQTRETTNPEQVASTSTAESQRPTLQRSRTYTREEFAPIREEDNVSRASSAGPPDRARSPVRFDIDLNGELDVIAVGEAGGESVMVNVPQNNYQDKGRAIIRFGARGHDNREFVWPRGVAVSRSDQIYVADSSNHRVQVFDSIGTFVKCFGSYGQNDAEFDCLAGVAINTMGDILITDRYNHRVQVFDHQLNFKLRFGEEGRGDGQLNYPWGIGTDSMGFIYVCDKENHRVQVFQSNGIFARKFGRLGQRPGQFENPHYLAISPDNKVYVSDSSNHRIQVFSMYGDFMFSFGSVGTMQGQMKYPKGIAIDDQGFVVVADSGNNRIQVFRGDGRFYCMFGSYGSDSGQFKGLEGLDLLRNGNVVVSDRENHRIQIF